MNDLKKDIVENILRDYPCSSAKQIAYLAKKYYNFDMTAPQVTGVLRFLYRKDKIAWSNCKIGYNVYWLKEDANGTEE